MLWYSTVHYAVVRYGTYGMVKYVEVRYLSNISYGKVPTYHSEHYGTVRYFF